MILGASAANAASVLINEFQPNPPGGDPSLQQIELLGDPGASFSGALISVETDNVSSFGQVQDILAFSDVFDSNGLLALTISDLENPSFLLALVGNDFTLALNNNVDANDDGDLDDIGAFGTVFDALSFADSAGDEVDYASELGGSDFPFIGVGAFNDEPELFFRDGRTLEALAINDLEDDAVAFNAAGEQISFSAFVSDPSIPTFGAPNVSSIPVPPAALLLLSALILGVGGLRVARSAS